MLKDFSAELEFVETTAGYVEVALGLILKRQHWYHRHRIHTTTIKSKPVRLYFGVYRSRQLHLNNDIMFHRIYMQYRNNETVNSFAEAVSRHHKTLNDILDDPGIDPEKLGKVQAVVVITYFELCHRHVQNLIDVYKDVNTDDMVKFRRSVLAQLMDLSSKVFSKYRVVTLQVFDRMVAKLLADDETFRVRFADTAMNCQPNFHPLPTLMEELRQNTSAVIRSVRAQCLAKRLTIPDWVVNRLQEYVNEYQDTDEDTMDRLTNWQLVPIPDSAVESKSE